MEKNWWAGVRQLREDLGAVSEINWWHPAWQGLLWSTSFQELLLRPRGHAVQIYRSANGGLTSDTFMARPAELSGGLVRRVARAVAAALAGVESLAVLKDRFAGQPLQACLQQRGGWLHPLPLDAGETSSAVFITPRGAFLARMESSRGPEIGLALLRLLTPGGEPVSEMLTPISPESGEAVRALLAVSLLSHSAPACRHLHRHAWSRGGGPWLGYGETRDLMVVTTCHRGTEGYGHALLTECISRAVIDRAPALAERLLARWPISDLSQFGQAAPAFSGSLQLGWATEFLSEGAGRFHEQAYAMGRALEIFYHGMAATAGTREAHFSPTFLVPVAPVSVSGEVQRDEIVQHGLLSLRIEDGRFESHAGFRRRLRQWVERERQGHGLFTRLSAANCHSRLPRCIKLRMLGSWRKPSALFPPIEVLAGRGRLSVMRFEEAERPSAPLYAVAAPTLSPTSRDPRGGQAMTLIHHDAGCTVTLVGTGYSGTDEGARAFLDLWLDHLAAVRSGVRSEEKREEKVRA